MLTGDMTAAIVFRPLASPTPSVCRPTGRAAARHERPTFELCKQRGARSRAVSAARTRQALAPVSPPQDEGFRAVSGARGPKRTGEAVLRGGARASSAAGKRPRWVIATSGRPPASEVEAGRPPGGGGPRPTGSTPVARPSVIATAHPDHRWPRLDHSWPRLRDRPPRLPDRDGRAHHGRTIVTIARRRSPPAAIGRPLSGRPAPTAPVGTHWQRRSSGQEAAAVGGTGGDPPSRPRASAAL